MWSKGKRENFAKIIKIFLSNRSFPDPVQISGTDLEKQFRLIRPDPNPRSESTTQQRGARKPSTRFERYLCFTVKGKFGVLVKRLGKKINQ
jgi:hypothetical protein